MDVAFDTWSGLTSDVQETHKLLIKFYWLRAKRRQLNIKKKKTKGKTRKKNFAFLTFYCSEAD